MRLTASGGGATRLVATLVALLLAVAVPSCRSRGAAEEETGGEATAAAGVTGPAGEAIEPPPGEDEGDAAAGTGVAEETEPEEVTEQPAPSFLSEQNRRDVTLFFQDAREDFLGSESRQIFLTSSIADQAKQIVVELINGPDARGLLPTLPAETRVLGVYIDRAGTAYVDLGGEVATRHPGGSSEELATVFSIVDSLTVNLPEIKRVHFLIDGEERETLKNHLDLQRDFIQDLSIVGPDRRR